MSTNAVHALSVANQELVELGRRHLKLSGSSWEQFRRYVGEHLVWCESEGVEVPAASEVLQRYGAYLVQARNISQRGWAVRRVYLNKLPAVVGERDRLQRLQKQRRRTRLVDALPAGSPLAVAIAEILDAVEPSYRRSLRCDLALVLGWCEERQLDPRAIGPAELSELRTWLRQSGRTSSGPLVAARRLYTAFYEPVVWWR